MSDDQSDNTEARDLPTGDLRRGVAGDAGTSDVPDWLFDDANELGPLTTANTTSQSLLTSPSPTKLVCKYCEVYFDAADEWEYCPRCAEELLEVEQA